MNRAKQYLRRRGILWLMLAGGLYCTALSLWHLGRTAMYVHEALTLPGTVIDVRQSHFDTQLQPLRYGNLSWAGDVSYQPIVAFDMPGGIRIRQRNMPDLDNEDYQLGQAVEVITLPHDPNQSHIHKWKFLWGGDCLLLSAGLLLGLPAWLILRYCPYTPKARPQTARPAAMAASAPATQPAKAAPTTVPQDNREEPFQLSATLPEPPKRRSPRQKKATGTAPTNNTGTNKKRSRKKTTATNNETAPTTPRDSRKPHQKKTGTTA